MFSIRQINATTWQLVAADGSIVGTFSDGPRDQGGRTGYDLALVALSGLLREQLGELAAAEGEGASAAEGDGLLPERWVSDEGLCFSELLPGGRDFRECAWSWRDPASSLVPVMLQTSTDFAHMGAELAGFVEEFHMDGTTPAGSGRFFDNEAGRQFRDLLLGDRRFGVSVDPSEAVEADYNFECVQWDDDGLCEMGEETYVFSAYEIAGFTGTPFPGFERASIRLESSEPAAASSAPVRAALSIPAAPPREWLMLAEPRPGAPFLGGLGDDVLVEQLAATGEPAGLACPLTITDDGQVFGHLTWWGQCHIGEPWGAGVCASAGMSRNGYADFMTGQVVCADGSSVPAGVLTVGCEHSSAFDVAGVRDHLAHAGLAWANVRCVDGEFGPWLSGALLPSLSEQQVRLLRGLSLSGEWVGELAGILAVNAPGLPVQRQLAASAFGEEHAPSMAVLRSSSRGGELRKLVGGNIVRRCSECEERRLAARGAGLSSEQTSELLRLVRTLEHRTRHLIQPEAEAVRASLHS